MTQEERETIIEEVCAKIVEQSKFFFIRKSDGEPIVTSGSFWVYRGEQKKLYLEWYTETSPFIGRYSTVQSFTRKHTYVGEL